MFVSDKKFFSVPGLATVLLNLARLVQSRNASLPRLVMVPSTATSFTLEKSANALLPMVVTLASIMMSTTWALCADHGALPLE
jgi:hypothetical protein